MLLCRVFVSAVLRSSLLPALVSTLVLKNTVKMKLFLLCLKCTVLTYCYILFYMKGQIHQTPPGYNPTDVPRELYDESLPHAMDVSHNVTSMQLSREDSAEEAGVDCIPTHKSQHISSERLLGGKCPLTIMLIWPPVLFSAGLLYVHAVHNIIIF